MSQLIEKAQRKTSRFITWWDEYADRILGFGVVLGFVCAMIGVVISVGLFESDEEIAQRTSDNVEVVTKIGPRGEEITCLIYNQQEMECLGASEVSR